MTTASKLHVCYVSGLDLRRAAPPLMPSLGEALRSGLVAHLTNVPSNELFPTLVTGLPPPRHGVWGVRLAPREPTSAERLLDHLPDSWLTTVQCLRHWADHRFDLAAVPPRRRRRLHLTRTKYRRRALRPEALHRIGGAATLFDVVGAGRSRYLFSASYDPERDVLPRIADGDVDLEFLELYSLDRHQQWNLDHEEETHRFHGVFDRYLAAASQKAARNGVPFLLVSDHGHQRIEEAIDLAGALKRLKIGPRQADWFIEVSNARFWCHDDGARRHLLGWLRALGKGTLLRWDEMRSFGIALEDESFGEIFYYLDPGKIFFPHDFHQPLASLWLGLTDPLQRGRLRDPRHRGNHGHLARFEVERCFALLQGLGFRRVRPLGNVVDVAPTILELLGLPRPPAMEGSPLFARRDAPTA